MGVEGMRSILEDCCTRDAVAETLALSSAHHHMTAFPDGPALMARDLIAVRSGAKRELQQLCERRHRTCASGRR